MRCRFGARVRQRLTNPRLGTTLRKKPQPKWLGLPFLWNRYLLAPAEACDAQCSPHCLSQQFMAVFSPFMCEAQQPFSWSLEQQSPELQSPQEAVAVLSLSVFMQDMASLPDFASFPAQHEATSLPSLV